VFDRLISNTALADTEWNVHVLINDETTNAFVLPGGKVFVYSGLLKQCSNDSELATVLGHEIAHVLAGHGSESVSRSLLWVPVFVVSCLVSGIEPDLVEVGVNVAFRYPNSRTKEREADSAGLLIMAESGFDPSAALNWWRKMEEIRPDLMPDYLSTHPSHQERLDLFHRRLTDARGKRPGCQPTGMLIT
jgi:predicted Zn-dependent protease